MARSRSQAGTETLEVSRAIRPAALQKHPRGPKRPKPKRASGKKRPHYATHRLLTDPQQRGKGLAGLVVLVLLIGRFVHGVWSLRSVWANIYVLNDPARRKLLKQDRSDFEKQWTATGKWTLLALPQPAGSG